MGREGGNFGGAPTPVAKVAKVENKEKLSTVSINDPDVLEKLAKLAGCKVEDFFVDFDEIEENKKYINSGDAALSNSNYSRVDSKNGKRFKIFTKESVKNDGHKVGDIILEN